MQKKHVSDVTRIRRLNKSTVTSSECKVLGDAGCKIVEPIHATVKSTLVIFKEKLAAEVTPATGKTLAKSSASGCDRSELDGEWALRGSQINELPEVEVEKVEHESVSKPSGSDLTLSGEEGSFEAVAEGTSTTKLASKKKWSAK